jgi:hypothetical protein
MIVSGQLQPRPLYPWVDIPRYSLYRREPRPQRQSGRYGEEKNLLLMPGIECSFLDPLSRNPVSLLTELSQLPNLYYVN